MNTRTGARRMALAAILALAAAFPAAAQTPHTFTFTGRLTQPDGTPVPDGTQSIRFSLWDAPSGGNLLWTSQLDLPAAHGVFNATLGGKDPFPILSPDDGRLYNASWLEIQVGDDVPMTPRLRVGPVPSAVRAATVDDGAINSASKLANGVVGTDQIAAAAVTSDKIAQHSITQDLLAVGLSARGPAGGDLTGEYPAPELASLPSSLGKVSGGYLTVGPGVPASDQSQAVRSGLSTTPHWQSFFASRNGFLTGLDLYCGALDGNSHSAVLGLYAGEGVGGARLAEQAITIGPATNWQHFDFSQPAFVAANQKYTWELRQYSGIQAGYNNSGTDTYLGAMGDAGPDYAFVTYVAAGVIGAGTTPSPSAFLTVVDPGAGFSGILVGSPANVAPGSNAKVLITEDGSTTQWPFEIDRSGAILYAVRQDGSVFSASSGRLKDNVAPLTDGLRTAMKLRPVSFDWKPEMGGGHDFGLIAEETARAMPALAVKSPDGTQSLGVRYDRVGVVAIKAIQQQQAIIAEQQARIAALEARLSALEAGAP